MDSPNSSRRQFLAAGGSAVALALAGCSGGGGETTTEGGKTTTEGRGTTTRGGTTADGGSDDATTTDGSGGDATTQRDGESSGSSFVVEVAYDGEWQGSISTASKSRSVQGNGTKTIEISGDPGVVSANAQKKDRGADKKLTIRILRDGEVLKESSTTAEYGMAQVTTSEYDTGTSESSSSESKLSVKVTYDGEWQGSISADGSARSVQGSGTKSIDVKGSPSVVSANAQKKDRGADKKLTVQILQGDEVLKESSTTAEYGMAQVTVTL